LVRRFFHNSEFIFLGKIAKLKIMVKFRSLIIESIFYLLAGAILYYLLASVEAFEWVYDYSRAHEDWDLDELILTIPVLLMVVSMFAYRRYRDLLRLSRRYKDARDKLQEANEKVVTLTKARERFMGIACHELKNPINNILSALKLIEMADSMEEKAEFTLIAKEASVGLRNYATEILDMTSMAVGAKGGEATPFDPLKVISDATLVASDQAKEKGLVFKVDVGPKVPDVIIGFPGHMRHILENLADNAVKYTGSGYVAVSCYVVDGPALQLVVTDSGEGIPADKIDHVFEAYFQGASSPAKGVGLGLSIAKQLVDVAGGTISVSSAEGQGSTFTVTLPYRMD